MSQVSGMQTARRSTPPQTPRPSLGWLPTLIALIVATIGVSALGCSSGQDRYPGLDGGPSVTSSGGPDCIGPTCPAACAAHPGPGCPCSIAGQHMACGKVEATYPATGSSPAQTVCGQGFSVCTAGVWTDCEITGSVIIVPNAPAGYYAQGLGIGTNCTANPCDPACKDFVDTPNGVAPGPGLQATDGGVSLSGGSAPPASPRPARRWATTAASRATAAGTPSTAAHASSRPPAAAAAWRACAASRRAAPTSASTR